MSSSSSATTNSVWNRYPPPTTIHECEDCGICISGLNWQDWFQVALKRGYFHLVCDACVDKIVGEYFEEKTQASSSDSEEEKQEQERVDKLVTTYLGEEEDNDNEDEQPAPVSPLVLGATASTTTPPSSARSTNSTGQGAVTVPIITEIKNEFTKDN
jgi:hypothetical protein